MEGYIGEIRLFAGYFAPRHWTFCQGQAAEINKNTVLFSILGNLYGGNGRDYFLLPDLRGRRAVHIDTKNPSDGLYIPGKAFGKENITLSDKELPKHHHMVYGNLEVSAAPLGFNGTSGETAPVDAYYGTADGVTSYYTGEPDVEMAPSKVTADLNISLLSSGNYTPSPIDIREPCLALNYIICIEGRFPPRN